MLFEKVFVLLSGKQVRSFIWDVLLFSRKTFGAGEIISIPQDKVLTLHCPSIDEEITIDGELYLL